MAQSALESLLGSLVESSLIAMVRGLTHVIRLAQTFGVHRRLIEHVARGLPTSTRLFGKTCFYPHAILHWCAPQRGQPCRTPRAPASDTKARSGCRTPRPTAQHA